MINTTQKEKRYAPVTYSRRMRVAELPPEIISKINARQLSPECPMQKIAAHRLWQMS